MSRPNPWPNGRPEPAPGFIERLEGLAEGWRLAAAAYPFNPEKGHQLLRCADDVVDLLRSPAGLAMCDAAEGSSAQVNASEQLKGATPESIALTMDHGIGLKDAWEAEPTMAQARRIHQHHVQPLLDRIAELGEHFDARTAERDALSERLSALLTAAQVPDGADAVEWVTKRGALADVGERMAVGLALVEDIEAAAVEVNALRTPPAPLPTEAGAWFLADGHVAIVYGSAYGRRAVYAPRSPSAVPPAAADPAALDWLAGPDGRCVRVEPPEVK